MREINRFYNRHFLRLLDFTPDEIQEILQFSIKLKKDKKKGKEKRYLQGKNIALLFEKDSTRTRCSFEVAAFDQSAQVTYLGKDGNQMGKKESIKDTVRVLGRIYNGIQYRGSGQKIVKILAQYAGIPVWNGLTNEFHPTQLLADLITVQDTLPAGKKISSVKFAYLGDAHNNIGNTLLEAAALVGIDLRLIGPKLMFPYIDLLYECKKISKKTGGKITLTEKISEWVIDIDYIYTDVWVSMGSKSNDRWKEKITLLLPYQVNMDLIHKTGNKNVKFMHCLPALHDEKTIIGRQIKEIYNICGGIEVSDEVFRSIHSVVFDQSENRLHAIKSVIVATLIFGEKEFSF